MTVTSNFEKLWVTAITLFLISIAIPNFIPQSYRDKIPSFLPSDTIVLGLDLKGGARFLFEIDADFLVKDQMESLLSYLRFGEYSLYSQGIKRYTNLEMLGPDKISVRITREEDVNPAERVLKMLEERVSYRNLDFTEDAINVELQNDNHTYNIWLTEAAKENIVRSALGKTLDIMRNRIDELGTKEPSIVSQGKDRLLVQIPGVDNIDPEIFGKTARLTFHLAQRYKNDEGNRRENLIQSQEFITLPMKNDPDQTIALEKQTLITGENLKDAQLSYDPVTKEPLVSFALDLEGARIFAKVTQENVGRAFAIVIDDEVISAPVIMEPIVGGSGQISGSFTPESASQLSAILRSGALPAPIKIVESGIIGPKLGHASFVSGTIASIMAFLAVVIYMGWVYKAFGIISSVSLAVNVIIIVGILTLLGATLTLPGIGGIILTVGIAVDINVIVFERIKEVIKSGNSKNIYDTLSRGYEMARSSILDANITTLITTFILFGMGAGPVKGFAVTLSIGVITSVFTAIYLTRIIVFSWVRMVNLKKISL